MNNSAFDALGMQASPVPPDQLAPGLRALVEGSVVLRGEVLTFAALPVWAGPPPAGDLTGWECDVNRTYLDELVPVEVGHLDDGEPVISEDDQVLMLRHGLRFGWEIARLVADLDEALTVRCIVSTNSTNGVFRFHRARRSEMWLRPDVDDYELDKIVVVDRGPASLGGTPW